MSEGGKNKGVLISAQAKTVEKLAEVAGVSGKTIDRVETILTKGTKEDIQALVLPLWAPLCLL